MYLLTAESYENETYLEDFNTWLSEDYKGYTGEEEEGTGEEWGKTTQFFEHKETGKKLYLRYKWSDSWGREAYLTPAYNEKGEEVSRCELAFTLLLEEV